MNLFFAVTNHAKTRRNRIRRAASFLGALSLMCALPCFTRVAQAQTTYPLSDILDDKGAAPLSVVQNLANAQKTVGPKKPSSSVEIREYDGYFQAASNSTKLALLSDDGTSVWIDDVQILNRAEQGQGFDMPSHTTFDVLPYSFQAGQVYHLRLRYTNMAHGSNADIDGLTLFAYGGGGTAVATPDTVVNAVSVDATNPAATVVSYRVVKGALSGVTFFAPGISNGVAYYPTTTTFSCTFDQRDVPLGSSNITLQYVSKYSPVRKSETFAVQRQNANSSANGVIYITVAATALPFSTTTASQFVQELYSRLTYTITVVPGSKTVRTNTSYANCRFLKTEAPSGFAERHQFEDATGVLSDVLMADDLRAVLIDPSDSYTTLRKGSWLDSHFNPTGLKGTAQPTIFYSEGRSIIPAAVLPTGLSTNVQ